MAAVWLIVVSVIVSLLLCGLSFYLVVYYSHPDDRNTAWVPKIIVILSFTLSELMVLFVALDVANLSGNPGCGMLTSFIYSPALEKAELGKVQSQTIAPALSSFATARNTTATNTSAPTPAPTSPSVFTSPCGELAMDWAWTISFYIVGVTVAVVIPFSIFLYENNDLGRKFSSRLCEALQYQGVALVVVGIALGVMYSFIDTFSYPVLVAQTTVTSPTLCSGQAYCLTNNPVYFNFNTSMLTISASASISQGSANYLISAVPNSFGIYLGCFLSFIGWFLFCIYTGTGLVMLPVDMVKAYLYRPAYIPKDRYIKLRDDIKRRVIELSAMGEKLKKERKQLDGDYDRLGYRERYSKTSSQRTLLRAFKREVEQAETDYEDIIQCHDAWKSYNPLIPYFKLVGGIISGLLSLCWVLQIVLYILPRYVSTGGSVPTYFLNDFMTWGLIYSGFAVIGVVFLAIFGLYLLACNVHGNFKIGLRFLIIEIHPMKVGATYMSSFLVNVMLLLLQSPALINFIAQSFSNTIVLTDADLIMNYMVRYTTFFVYFFENNVFIFLLLAFVVLAMCLTYALPDDQKRAAKRLKRKVEKLENDLADKEKQTNTKTRGLGLKSITERAKQANAQRDKAAVEGDANANNAEGNEVAKE